MPETRPDVPIEIREFEPFLQKCLDCDHLVLVDYTATAMLPPGENFCSSIVKVDARVRKNTSPREEDVALHFVAKTPDKSNRAVVDWVFTFRPEVFAYAEVVPAYREVEEKLGIEEPLDFHPKFFGSRNSLEEDNQDSVDQDSMLLLENLGARGYYMVDKYVGLDVEHARKVTVCLARFHALGMAVIRLRPDIPEKMIALAASHPFDFGPLDDTFDSVLKVIRDNGSLRKHIGLMEPAFAEAKNGNLWIRTDCGKFATIIHGDIWINNLMFHKDEQGRVDDVKLLDFQSFQCNSALRDVSRFLTSSLHPTTRSRHSKDLIDLYYETFIEWTDKVGCDSKRFTKEDYVAELKRQSVIQFPLCAMGLKIILANEGKTEEIIQPLQQLIDTYEDNGWF
ncbi:uncharacterized protein LOC106637321 [Copidosoma floridanum]|uniref:uncharacterized protein LOC106637321 n=1 Tax=Copidosoma floridanum TaxID=29053 RepID=UPI0006C98FA8|nr:uncharacterized protein LOC106637321 [Copidosoma floridanum]